MSLHILSFFNYVKDNDLSFYTKQKKLNEAADNLLKWALLWPLLLAVFMLLKTIEFIIGLW